MAVSLDDLLDVYGSYARRQGLKSDLHLTHLLLIISEIAEASLWLSKSKDSMTDRFAETIQSLSKLYRCLDTRVEDYKDTSKPFTLDKEKYPLVYIGLITDVIIHLLAYIAENGWSDEFMNVIDIKMLNDDKTGLLEKGRFQNNRIGWKKEA